MSEEAFFIMMCRIERLWMFSTLICVTDVPQLEFSKEQLCQCFKKSPPVHLLWLTSLAQHTISHQFSVFSFHPKRTPEKKLSNDEKVVFEFQFLYKGLSYCKNSTLCTVGLYLL